MTDSVRPCPGSVSTRKDSVTDCTVAVQCQFCNSAYTPIFTVCDSFETCLLHVVWHAIAKSRLVIAICMDTGGLLACRARTTLFITFACPNRCDAQTQKSCTQHCGCLFSGHECLLKRSELASHNFLTEIERIECLIYTVMVTMKLSRWQVEQLPLLSLSASTHY